MLVGLIVGLLNVVVVYNGSDIGYGICVFVNIWLVNFCGIFCFVVVFKEFIVKMDVINMWLFFL